MEKIQAEIFKDKCPFCSKDFTSLYIGQLKQNLEDHLRFCKKNPSNNKK